MWLIWLSFFVFGNTFAQIIVDLPAGKIKGNQTKTYDGKPYLAFKGIPFGEPPVGKLRFQPPQPAKKWAGVIELPKSTNICYELTRNSPRENEDCLYIYVYTPVLNAASNKTKLPVMFSIYGGGFRDGSVGINPNYWVENDVVVVSANYRGGAFGFLSTGDLVLPGNAGLKDQLLALQWTYDNIHLFGGDNSKITIQGQSAGGASVGYLLLSPKAKGLYRAAIAESGSPLNTWTYLYQPFDYVVALSQLLNPNMASNSSSAEYLNYLQSVSASKIDWAQFRVLPMPVIFVEPKHDGAFISESMYVSFEKGQYNQVPLILGVNSEEKIGIGLNLTFVRECAKRADDNNDFSLPDSYFLEDESKKSEAGKLIHDVYAEGNDNLTNHLGRYIGWESDNRFTRGVIKQGQLMSKYSPVYFYQFSYKGPAGGHKISIPEADWVAHAEELNYFAKDQNLMTPADALTAKRVLNMWLTFIKDLNPTPQKLQLLENIVWPQVTPNNYQYLNINTSLSIEIQPKGQYFLGWQNLFEKYMKKPFTTY